MKIMGLGAGSLICVGFGIAFGLFGLPGWGWQVLVVAIVVAYADVLFKSEHYKSYLANCEGKQPQVESHFLRRFVRTVDKTEPSVALYILLSFLMNSVIIFGVTLAIFFLKVVLVSSPLPT